ncbi:hypothetical protein AMS68_000421 [Peltaster fructicola]|uniref:Transcriptional coactivator p15 (PC4) C-terminal domain-containing protein n=1 Tax=Peltaster fructicola TaxID=286661 RepID=A0A6H0XJL0_9PEZI|nr:hypothetical protein AMS68_000421 [Peltaster fructicola]
MPKPLSRKRVASEDYESDGGFVEDAPKSKKSKATSEAGTGSFGQLKDEEGGDFWEITRTRRVQVSEFKGKTMISIREFYEKDGKMLPGKKGISLTLEQFNTVVELLPNVEGLLSSKGLVVNRPAYSNQQTSSSATDDATADEPDNAKSASKANHEATSDEED